MHIQHAAVSTVGPKRENNEDSYSIESHDAQGSIIECNSVLFTVADGMAGHPCGEIASVLACESFKGFLERHRNNSAEEFQGFLVQRFFYADDQVRIYADQNPFCLDMGTTLSALAIIGEKAVVAHIGDTRIYCLHNGNLRVLTKDHTLVQKMFEEGVLTSKTAATSSYRNKLTKVLGTNDPLESVDTTIFEVFSGDRFLLSTDGLHDTVSFNEIELIMREGGNPEKTADRLLSRAKDTGGQDDTTLIVVFTK
jgi:PPM family protein phosphatase